MKGNVMSDEQEYPILKPIYGDRWAAHGPGWAVHGDTQEEAIENYHKAEARHQEILAIPREDAIAANRKQEIDARQVSASPSYLLECALHAEGASHKQWYLWQLAKSLGMDLSRIDADPGIAP